MKKYLPKVLILLLIIISMSDCSEETSSLNITSITLNTETSMLLTNSVTFTASNQDGLDITDQIVFNVDNNDIEGNAYTPTKVGNFYVFAKYEKVRSSSIKINVIENITSLTLSSDRSDIKPNNSTAAIFTVHNQLDEDVTDLVQLYIGDGFFTRDKFTTDEYGVFDFTAKYLDIVSNEISITSSLNVTALTLTADRTTIPANGGTSVELYALDQDQDTISTLVSFYSDDNLMNGSKFQTTTVGSFDISAKYASIESNVVSISSVPQKTNRKILIEEFTGEWCGWCPQAAFNLDKIVKENSQVLTVGIHNDDALEYENEGIIRGAFGLNYFPSGLLGRVNMGSNVGYNGVELGSEILNEIDRQLNQEEILGGLSINTSISGNDALIDVNVDFYNNIQETVNITIYLIENDVMGNIQQNYFAGHASYPGTYYYSQPAQIENYVHQYVLRKVASDVYGDEIPSSEVTTGNVYSVPQKTIDVTGYDTSKCFVIAFIHYDLDGNAENKSIINAQQVKLGNNIGYEE